MSIVKVIGIALVAIISISLLKNQRPEFTTYISIIAGLMILYMIVRELTPIVSLLQNLSDKMGITNRFFVILLKITGIAYLTEFGSNVCKDSGESAIATKVEIARKSINY